MASYSPAILSTASTAALNQALQYVFDEALENFDAQASGSEFAHELTRNIQAMVSEASLRFARSATLRSSFVRLPAELLSECAQQLHQRDIINVSATCSILRTTLIQMSAVWTRAVYIDTASKPLAELLRRSGEMDLDLDIRLGLGPYDAVEDAVEALMEHASRLKSLSIRLSTGPNPLNVSRVTRFLSAATPRLRTCIFRDPHSIYNYNTIARVHFYVPPLFGQHAPLLTTVKVAGSLDTFLTGGAFSNVRRLVLHPERQPLDLPQLLQVTPALETLGIYCSKNPAIHATTANAFGAATTPHLSELWLHLPRLRSMLPILRSIPHTNLRRTCVAIQAGDSHTEDVQETGRALRSITELYFEGDMALEAHVRITNPKGDSNPNSVQYIVLYLRRVAVTDVERELVVHALPIDALKSVLHLVHRLVLDTFSRFTVDCMAHMFSRLGICDSVTEIQIRAISAQLAMSILHPIDDDRRSVFPNLARLALYRVKMRDEPKLPALVCTNLFSRTNFHADGEYESIPHTFAQDVRALAGGRILQRVEFVGWTLAEADRAKLLRLISLVRRITAQDVVKDDTPTMWKRMDELSGFLKLRM